jgi:hypothetical protein
MSNPRIFNDAWGSFYVLAKKINTHTAQDLSSKQPGSPIFLAFVVDELCGTIYQNDSSTYLIWQVVLEPAYSFFFNCVSLTILVKNISQF